MEDNNNEQINRTYTPPTFQQQTQEVACFECGSPHANWVSVTYGIYLCLNCSGLHRSLGVTISYVKSITMDTLDENQQNSMYYGGNDRLRQFFIEQEVDKLPLTTRYHTKAAAYYKALLLSKVKSTMPPEPLGPGEGSIINAPVPRKDWTTSSVNSFSSNPIFDNNSNFETSYNRPTSSRFEMGETFNNLFQNAIDVTKTIKDKTVSSVRENGVIGSAKSAISTSGSWIGEKTANVTRNLNDEEWWKNTSNNVTQKATDIQTKVSTVASGAANQASYWWDKAYTKSKSSELWNRLPSFRGQNGDI